MTLCEINVYPIKSAKGISVRTALVERRGIQFDRRWMVVDASGVFLSQRGFPRLALISTHLDSDTLHVNAPGMNTLTLSLQPSSPDPIRVHVWNDGVDAISAGDEAQKWFSTYLDMPSRLVFMPENSIRQVQPKSAIHNDIVSFADGFPLLLISQQSLDDLNNRLVTPVRMNRFRPNVVVNNSNAFAEDRWKKIRIGTMLFYVVKPCSRCVTTTVDQETGIQGKEPLATLSRYRKVDGNVLFGQNIIPENVGTITIGDRVEIIG
jgi:uncharacterized protein YcbX